MIYSKYPLKVMEEVAPFPPIQNTANPYLTEAAMHLDQANQLQGYGYLVTDVGAFTYLGTLAGSSADYEGFMPTKDISLRSDNTASTIYFQDSLTHDLLYSFIRYNASSNYLEFGSNDNDGRGNVVSAQIDRGKQEWEFKSNIIINKPGRGVTMFASENARYEIRTNNVGVLELWTVSSTGNLETLVWSSVNTPAGLTKTGTSLDLSNISGNNYNYAAFSAATAYTVAMKVINGFARCFINAATEPTVTGATKKAGSTFQSNTNMEMVVESPNGAAVEFYFVKRV